MYKRSDDLHKTCNIPPPPIHVPWYNLRYYTEYLNFIPSLKDLCLTGPGSWGLSEKYQLMSFLLLSITHKGVLLTTRSLMVTCELVRFLHSGMFNSVYWDYDDLSKIYWIQQLKPQVLYQRMHPVDLVSGRSFSLWKHRQTTSRLAALTVKIWNAIWVWDG